MACVQMFAKPGCIGNRAQRQALERAGHRVDEIDLLSHEWNPERLLAFLAGLPVADWFNPTAPMVKAGQVVPEQLDADSALALLLAQPLLIRRPLLRIGDHHLVGYDPVRLEALLGTPLEGKESCPRPATPCVRG